LAIFEAIYPTAATGVELTAAVISARIAVPLNAAGEVPEFVWVTVITTSPSVPLGGYAAYQDSVQFNFGDGTVTANGGLQMTATDPGKIFAVPAGATYIAAQRTSLAQQDSAIGISALNQPGPP
jgi:hypothetical protein